MPIIVVRCRACPRLKRGLHPWGANATAVISYRGVGDAFLATRLRRLPRVQVMGREVCVATGLRARLLGLAGLDRAEVGDGLLIPRCTGVHTFGMRFALDLCFLDSGGEALVRRLGVPPRKLAFCAGASAVLELPAEEGGEISVGPS